MAVCIARANRTGNQCRLSAIRGATVCRVHGGMAPQVQKVAAARVAAAEVFRLLGEDIEPIEIKDPRAVMDGLTVRSHAFLDRLQQAMRENPTPGQMAAWERAVDRTANLTEALEKMDQVRSGRTSGPQVIVIESRPPWERGSGDIIDVPAQVPAVTGGSEAPPGESSPGSTGAPASSSERPPG